MRRWRKISDFSNAIMFSIAYIIVTLFTLVATTHPKAETTLPSPDYHPWWSIFYLIFSLLITWSFYFYTRKKTTIAEFITSLLLGIILIIVGILLWVSTIRY